MYINCCYAGQGYKGDHLLTVGLFCRYDVSKKYPQGKTLSPALEQVFDPELSSWLLAELAENRDKKVGPNKVSSSRLCSPFEEFPVC